MSQLWDFPRPGEDPSNIWEGLKDTVLPKDKHDMPSDIWKDLKDAVLPEHKQVTPNDIWANLKTAILSEPDNKNHQESNVVSIPEIKITPASSDSKQVQSSKESENGNSQADESDTLTMEIEVAEPTLESKSVPTSDESEYTDAQEELDTPSVSEAKVEQNEVRNEEKTALMSSIPVIDGFESSDVADFLSLGDNSQVREKLEAILREDEPKDIQSVEVEDHNGKLRKQGPWAAEGMATLKSGSILKDKGDEEDGGSRELRRVRTELDAISQKYEPKTAYAKPGDKGAKLKTQGSWDAEIRASLRSGFATKAVQKNKETESNSVGHPASPQAKKSIGTWVADAKAALESAPITESTASSEVIESRDAQTDEQSDISENPESAQIKRDNSYFAMEVKKTFALAAVTQSLQNSETEYTQAVDEPESNRRPVKEPGSVQTSRSIGAWVAGDEAAADEARDLKPVPNEEYGNNELSEKQKAPIVDGSKKRNWFSPNQDSSLSTDGPNSTISWDFWAEEQEDTPKFKKACRTGYDTLAYPMSRIVAERELNYQPGIWREDLSYESLNEGSQPSPSYEVIQHFFHRRESVSTNSFVVSMGKAAGDEGADAKAYQ